MTLPTGLFSWVDVAVPDRAAGIAFYSHVFGWEAAPTEMGYTIFTRDGATAAGLGELSREQVAAGEKPGWSSHVLVADCDAVTERARGLGATVIVPPTTIDGTGRFSYVADPFGAVLGLWQPIAFHGADRFNEPGFLCWNELVTGDVPAAQAFYRALMPEWTVTEHEYEGGYRYTMVKVGDRDNAGMEGGDAGVPSHWAVYLTVENMDAAVGRVVAAGGSLLGEVRKTGVGLIATVRDDQGAVFRMIDMSVS